MTGERGSTADQTPFRSEQCTDGRDRPRVPSGVLRGIENIESGETASVEDIAAVVDWGVETTTDR